MVRERIPQGGMEVDDTEPEAVKLSQILVNIFDPNRGKTTVGELVSELDHHGMAIVLILFSIPSALPVPAAGYSTLLSLPLLFIGLRLLAGRNTVWLPERAKGKTFDPADFQRVKFMMLRVVRILERFSKPRLYWLAGGRLMLAFLGSLICALACFMALPIPGTNTLPAGGIFLIGFGMLENDGLLTVCGILYSIAAVTLGFLIIFLGYEVVKGLILYLF